jgi:hypothetical protein
MNHPVQPWLLFTFSVGNYVFCARFQPSPTVGCGADVGIVAGDAHDG